LPDDSHQHSQREKMREYRDRLAGIDADDVHGIRAILISAKADGVSEGEMAFLTSIFCEDTNFPKSAMYAIIKEVRNHKEGHGVLETALDIGTAFAAELRKAYEHAAWVGGCLYIYEEGYYQRYDEDAVEQHLLSEFAEIPGVHSLRKRKEAIIHLSKQLQDDDFFADAAPGVNLENGFAQLDLRNGLVLVAHSHQHKARMKLAAAFDALAPHEWLDEAMSLTLPDPDKRKALQEVLGAILFNVTPLKDSIRRLIFLHGPRNSGKSTIISLVEALVPPQVVASVPPGNWSDPYYRAGLQGVAVNVVTELGASTRIAGEHIKKIGSGEPISARLPYGRPFNFRCFAWHLFATNELPRVQDSSDASERRMLCLNFDRSLQADQIDADFLDRVGQNPSALLRWAAAGAVRLQTDGRFTLPRCHARSAAVMRHGSDLAAILAETRVEAAPAATVTTIALRGALRSLAIELGIDPDNGASAITDGTVKRLVGELARRYGATRHKNAGAPFYRGVRLVDAAPPVDDANLAVSSEEDTDLSDL
jgi:hypothetical protein